MTQELTPNTQITQENVVLLKEGDWLMVRSYANEMKLCQLAELPRKGSDILKIHEPGQSVPNVWGVHRFTYIGPDLGDGWIGWSGGENPVPGVDVEVRLDASQPEEFGGRSDSYEWEWYCDGEGGDIIAFRPTLSPPAEGESDVPWYGDRDPHEVDQASGEYDGASCELCGRERVMIGGATGRRICEKCGHYQEGTPTPAPIDWTVVGPKLVEAVWSLIEHFERVDAHDLSKAVIAQAQRTVLAAQPERQS